MDADVSMVRLIVKKLAKEQGLTYGRIAESTDIEESTIKSFMCGASDSRRVAEKLADVLGISLLYRDGRFYAYSEESAPSKGGAV